MLALGTAERNIAAALVVVGQDFSDPKVVVMVVVVAIVGLLVLMPIARVVARATVSTQATTQHFRSCEEFRYKLEREISGNR